MLFCVVRAGERQADNVSQPPHSVRLRTKIETEGNRTGPEEKKEEKAREGEEGELEPDYRYGTLIGWLLLLL